MSDCLSSTPRGKTITVYSTVQVYEERFERAYGFYRPYLRSVIYRYLDCGILRNGFARVRCGECGHVMMKLAAFGANTPFLYRLGMIVMRRMLKKGGQGLMAPALKEWTVCREPPKPQEGESFRDWWRTRSHGQ